MIRLLNPGLMDQVMWLGGWNEVYVGRHIPVKVVCSTWHNMDSSKTAIMHKLMLHAHKCLLLMWVTVLIAEMNEVYHESLTERLCNGLGLHPYPGRCSVQIWGLYAPMGSTAHVRWTMQWLGMPLLQNSAENQYSVESLQTHPAPSSMEPLVAQHEVLLRIWL